MPVHEDLLQLLENQMPMVGALHARGSLAPLAASMSLEGEIVGEAFVVKNQQQAPTVDDVLDHFRDKFAEALRNGSIRASVVFFHGYLDGDDVRPAHYPEEAEVVAAWLWHSTASESVQALIRYGVSPGSGTVDIQYDAPTFTPAATLAPRPTIIFLPRTFPREGESTVIRIENDLVALLKDRIEILDLSLGVDAIPPAATTMDADGTILGELPTSRKASHAGESLHAALNNLFAELRQQLEAGAITCAGVFCYGSIEGDDSRFTEMLDEANVLTAWLVHRTQIVEVSIPYNNHPAEGESSYGSPTGEIVGTLPFVSGQHVRWTFHPPSISPSGITGCSVGGHALAIHQSGLVERWDLAEGLPIEAIQLPHELSACAVSGDGAWYVTGSPSGKVALWNAERHEQTPGPSEPDAVAACALDQSGNRALVMFANGAVVFWDLLRGKTCWSNNAAGVCALSADGTRALTSSRGGPPVLWDVSESDEPEIRYTLRADQSEITAAAMSARGHAALTASADGKTLVWDLDLKRSRHALNGPGPVRACVLTPDGQFALVAHDGLTVLWDAFAGYPLQQIRIDGHHSALAFTADGTSALLGSSDGTLTYMELFPS